MTHCVIFEMNTIRENQTNAFRSKTGQLIHVRPLEADDAPLLVDVFNHMTSESRYRRFHQTVDHVSDGRKQQEAENIAQADPERNWGLIAFANTASEQNVPIGAVRIVQTERRVAEVAISIRDDFQNMGIGSQLMSMIANEAERMGFERLVADIQNDNVAVWRVFKKLPYEVMRIPEGATSKITISLITPREETG